ncbi:hypothetical protein FGG08_007540 [Glutinoglossum americanum]|uniref:Uncharacterized protein n=1 Tax=Glutinoglossum americanum TaxID=1670608 RepID=A0A9P8KZ72_9PEZI|nr:hypothetical protein FGG08_007540 [Glutinoglossum americanum]
MMYVRALSSAGLISALILCTLLLAFDSNGLAQAPAPAPVAEPTKMPFRMPGQFSVVYREHTDGADSKAGVVVKMYQDGDKYRADAVSAAGEVTVIVRGDLQKSYRMTPASKQYAEQAYHPNLSNPLKGMFFPGKWDKLGTEELNAKLTDKYKLTEIKSNTEYFFWVDQTTGCVVQRKAKDKISTFTDYKIGPQSPDLFEIPKDYTAITKTVDKEDTVFPLISTKALFKAPKSFYLKANLTSYVIKREDPQKKNDVKTLDLDLCVAGDGKLWRINNYAASTSEIIRWDENKRYVLNHKTRTYTVGEPGNRAAYIGFGFYPPAGTWKRQMRTPTVGIYTLETDENLKTGALNYSILEDPRFPEGMGWYLESADGNSAVSYLYRLSDYKWEEQPASLFTPPAHYKAQ